MLLLSSSSPFYAVLGPESWTSAGNIQGGSTHLVQLKLENSSQICPEVSHQDVSRFCQLEKQYKAFHGLKSLGSIL